MVRTQASAAGADIPWRDEAIWLELKTAVTAITASAGKHGSEIYEIADRIRHGYQQLEEPMELLCGRTCLSCREVCCRQATLWYDLQDLLFISLISGELPARQIDRLPDGACCNLGPEGCVLPRWQRPFICSWYICAQQRAGLQWLPETVQLEGRIERLKSLRKQLFAACVTAVCP